MVHKFYEAMLDVKDPKCCELTCFPLRYYRYHMYGSGTQLLRAYHMEGKRSTIIFEKMGSQGDRWQIADVPIGRIRGAFNLQIGARKSYTAEADIAIDDIKLIGCGVPQPPTTGQCNPNIQFT